MHIQNPFKKHQERERVRRRQRTRERGTDRQTQIDRQTDRQTDRQSDTDRQRDRNRDRGRDYYTTSSDLSGLNVTPAHHPHGFPFYHYHHSNPFQPEGSYLSVCLVAEKGQIIMPQCAFCLVLCQSIISVKLPVNS